MNTSKSRLPIATRIVMLLALAALPAAHAALPASESFDYTAGQNIISSTAPKADGGLGWTSSWYGGGAATVVASTTTISKTIDGFIYGSGNSMAISGGDTIAAAKRTFSSTAITDGSDIYVSFLVQYTGGTGNVTSGHLISVGLLDSVSDTSSSVDNFILLNRTGALLDARVNNTTSSISSGTFQFAYGTPTLVVGRYAGWNGSAYTTTTVWVNPTAADFSTTSISATATSTTGSDGARGLAFRTNTLGTDVVLFDDIRVGKTWASVVAPIPEPGTYALLVGFSAACLAGIRRRRR